MNLRTMLEGVSNEIEDIKWSEEGGGGGGGEWVQIRKGTVILIALCQEESCQSFEPS